MSYLLSTEVRHLLAKAMLQQVESDPKMLLHFAQNHEQIFNVSYPSLFASDNHEFKYYYDGLLDILEKQIQDSKQRHD